MMKKYNDADAFISVEGREYALYKNGSLKRYPYMVDISTGEIPEGEQRPLLKAFLLSCKVNIEPWKEKNTHWCIKQAIKSARRKNLE